MVGYNSSGIAGSSRTQQQNAQHNHHTPPRSSTHVCSRDERDANIYNSVVLVLHAPCVVGPRAGGAHHRRVGSGAPLPTAAATPCAAASAASAAAGGRGGGWAAGGTGEQQHQEPWLSVLLLLLLLCAWRGGVLLHKHAATRTSEAPLPHRKLAEERAQGSIATEMVVCVVALAAVMQTAWHVAAAAHAYAAAPLCCAGLRLLSVRPRARECCSYSSRV